MTIGGIDASLWIGRRVRLNDKRRCAGHFMRGTLIEIQANGKAVVRPDGHRGTDVVDLTAVSPWWSQNPDLQRRRRHDGTAVRDGLRPANPD